MMTNTRTLNVTTPSDCEIVVTRDFDAPRSLVWKAMSEPELLKRWCYGPPGWSMVTVDDDLRVGGKYRWVWSHEDGKEMALTGVYREVQPPERVVRTEVFEFGCVPMPGEQVSTMVLIEQAGRTMLTLTIVYASKEARDAALATGMDSGMAAGYARVDELLESLVKEEK